MQQSFPTLYVTVLAIVLAGLIMLPAPLPAQETGTVEEVVVVEAPFERELVERTSPTMETELIELTRRVSFADLDLSKHKDVTEFESRIEAVSTDACEKLAKMYPFDTSDKEVKRCIKEAIASAEGQKEQAIAEAN